MPKCTSYETEQCMFCSKNTFEEVFSFPSCAGKKMNKVTKIQTNPTTSGLDTAPCFKVKTFPFFLSCEKHNERVRNKVLIRCLKVRNKALNHQ